MVVTTTSAAALAAGSVIQGLPPSQRAGAITLLTLIAGVAMIVAGAVRLGRYTRFVSRSVMIGFLTGVAANIVFGQIPDLTGTKVTAAFPLDKAVKVLAHPSRIGVASLLTGLAAIVLTALLSRVKRLRAFAALIALIVPTLVVSVAGLTSVERVEDLGAVPKGLPLPALPPLGHLSFELVAGALAVAAIVLVQGSGVSESAPNVDGTPSDTNRDFIAQGVGNVAAGFFKGQPVGGSVGQTALNMTAGARTRWAAIFSGLWMLVILVLFSGVVGKVAMPTLAGLLIVAAIGSVRVNDLVIIWRTGSLSCVALSSTFIFTLLLPVATAVGIGVAISLLLQLNQAANNLTVVELTPTPEGQLAEQAAPDRLVSHRVTMLDVYGSLRYAGARTLQAHLPDPAGSEQPAVVFRLRGRTALGSTSFGVIEGYAAQLHAVGGRLFLAGVDPQVAKQFARVMTPLASEHIEVFEATPIHGDSSRAAYEAATAWVNQASGHNDTNPEPT